MGEIREIPWRDVRPMADQPRTWFDPASLQELAASIAAVGQQVPAVVVRRDDRVDRFELIDGERRWRAIQVAKVPTLRAEVVDEPDPEARFRRSVVANLAREGNTHIEIASACSRLRKTMSVIQIAAMLGKSEAYVYQYLGLINLHIDVLEAMHPSIPSRQRLAFTAATMLCNLPSGEQLKALAEIQASGLTSLRATRLAVANAPAARVMPPSHQGPRDAARSILVALDVLGERLDRYNAGRWAEMVRVRPREDQKKVRDALARVARKVAEIQSQLC